MARLIRTEKEVEGRYEEVWLVVDEDSLEQWPEGPREIVGRPATRVDGFERARGEATFTADLRLSGMLHTAVLRSPYASREGAPNRPRPCAGAAGRPCRGRAGRHPAARRRLSATRASPSRRFAPTAFAHAQAAVAAIDVEWEVREPLLDPDEAVRRELAARRAAPARARRLRARARRGRRRRLAASTRPPSSSTTRWRPTRRSCSGSVAASRCTSRRSTSGGSAPQSPKGSRCRPTRCA